MRARLLAAEIGLSVALAVQLASAVRRTSLAASLFEDEDVARQLVAAQLLF
jgi:hypothetical protein